MSAATVEARRNAAQVAQDAVERQFDRYGIAERTLCSARDLFASHAATRCDSAALPFTVERRRGYAVTVGWECEEIVLRDDARIYAEGGGLRVIVHHSAGPVEAVKVWAETMARESKQPRAARARSAEIRPLEVGTYAVTFYGNRGQLTSTK